MIRRNVSAAATERFDLIVVGGGIYGAQMTMEAARRGLRPLLIERDDFGGATSWSSLRIVHGGLRYLQKLDLRRFRESVSERSWFCRTFPDLVRPLECLMPLYGDGLRRPAALRVALAVNDLLSRNRNVGVPNDLHLPAGRVLGAAETQSLFPLADAEALRGGAVWHDAVMSSSARVLIETLKWACANGAAALNYVEGVRLLESGGRVAGVEAVDRTGGATLGLHAPVVLNCAGPWSRQVAERFDREHAALFRPSLAFNVLFERPPPSRAAVAVTPRYAGARTYFLRPWRGRLLAGTFHAPRSAYPARSAPEPAEMQRFLQDLDRAVPALGLTADDIIRTYAGVLPATRPGTEDLAIRPTVIDHRRMGGPEGLWSVSGVKYTTARRVAEDTLRRVFGASGRDLGVRPGSGRPEPRCALDLIDFTALPHGEVGETRRELERLIEEESALCMRDLLLRRTDWGTDPEEIPGMAARVTELLGRALPDRAVAHEAGAGADA